MTPTPAVRSSRTTVNSRACSRWVRDAVGSSMMTIRAPAPTAQAISTSCCSGIESSPTSVSGAMVAPTRASKSTARARRAGVLESQTDVFGDGKVGEKGGLLVDARNTELLGEGGGESVEGPTGHG